MLTCSSVVRVLLPPQSYCHFNHASCLQVVEDLAGPAPMHRLLQGDVGSGKTAVAFLAMLAAAGSGCQAALMAPTEVRGKGTAEYQSCHFQCGGAVSYLHAVAMHTWTAAAQAAPATDDSTGV